MTEHHAVQFQKVYMTSSFINIGDFTDEKRSGMYYYFLIFWILRSHQLLVHLSLKNYQIPCSFEITMETRYMLGVADQKIIVEFKMLLIMQASAILFLFTADPHRIMKISS